MAGKPRRKKKRTAKQRTPEQQARLRKILMAVLCVGIVCVLTASIVCGYVLINVISFVRGDCEINLNDYKENQDQTTIIYAYDTNGATVEVARLHGAENRIWVDIEKIPQDFQDAYVALEDKRFPDHHGVDWIRTASAVILHGGSQGGSTITQQLIKNLTQENKRTFVRKFREIEYALNLEKYYEKTDILEAYMNTLYLSHGCYGVQTGAQYYFGKDVSELNLAECACLAAITQAPTANDPTINPETNRSRMKVCLYAMKEQGYITQEEYDEALNYELVFTKGKSSSEEETKVETKINSYYVDYVIDSVIDDLIDQYDYTTQQATNLIYSGGLRIYSAVDMNVQTIMEDVYVNRKTFANDTVQSSMTIMDYSGRVVGIVGGAGKKTQNRGLNRAADSPRQPGSSVKPLSVYSVAIENNVVNWSTKLTNFGIFMMDGQYWPKNQGGVTGSPSQTVTVQNGIARSLNTISAQTLKRVGVQKSFDWMVNNMHITSLVPDGEMSDVGYSQLATGSMTYGITTLEMTAAYASFGNGGVYYKPYCYYSVTNSNGKTIYLQHEDAGEHVMKADTADVICRLLQTVVTDPSGTGRAYGVSGFPTMFKTGTTTDSFDRWVAGGTPYYVAAVWYGYDKNKEVTDSGNPAGKIFKEIMTRVHKGLDKSKTFVTSNTVVSRQYCLVSGNLADSSCQNKATGWYAASALPPTCTVCAGSAPSTTVATTQPGTPATGTTAPPETTTEATTVTTTKDPNIVWEG